ncbi:hypothetical protein TRFO_09519 [Tritrichomonas foetus]|uniref:Uncharacterized protein n=1 Tax=Tritrichomonas foetus TaxID=1144522 RepID=A0A1J4JDM5_9EUKA|nr:hypothetical protein TRFO_09519 [Tritrichomonas foetus]|eukprot:OHS97258.1 hypothetical protein TRFO_09519 [Tritrichomonas foetus]
MLSKNLLITFKISMSLSYKSNNTDYSHNRHRFLAEILGNSNENENIWSFQHNSNLNHDSQNFEQLENLRVLIYEQIALIVSDYISDRIESINKLNSIFCEFPFLVQYFQINDDVLYAIQSIIFDFDQETLSSAIQLLKLLVMNSPIVVNYFDTEVPIALISCLEHEIPYSLAFDVIEILASLITLNDERAISYYCNKGIITKICDIASYFNSVLSITRKEESWTELPFYGKENNINESNVLIFPILKFAYNIVNTFKWEDYDQFLVTQELMEHIIGILLETKSKNEQSQTYRFCIFDILFNLSTFKSELLIDLIERMSMMNEIISASILSSNYQIRVLKVLQNIAYSQYGSNLLGRNHIFDAIFNILGGSNTNNDAALICFKILNNISFHYCNLQSIRKYDFFELFQLDRLSELIDNMPFSFKVTISQIFVNLLDQNLCLSEILQKIDVFHIMLPLLQSHSQIEGACEVLIKIIEKYSDDEIILKLCNDISDLNLLETCDDSGSTSVNIYQAILGLQTVINEKLENEDD